MSRPYPPIYVMTGKFTDRGDFESKLQSALRKGPKVVQLRSKGVADTEAYLELAGVAESLCRRFDSILLLAATAEILAHTGADGLHLGSDVLHHHQVRPVGSDKRLSVSCHTLEDMQLADRLGADLLLLSPVKATSSHPDLPAIGWERFGELAARFEQPVYALGGMTAGDLDAARAAGGQGVAAISAFWD